MAVSINNYPICTFDSNVFNRKYSTNANNKAPAQKELQTDTVEITGIKENRKNIIEQVNHTVIQSAALFSDTRAGILQDVRKKQGNYGYAEVINACGFSYAKLYAEIEERHQDGEHFFKPDGTVLTKEDEIMLLDKTYDNEVAWQMACTKTAIQREIFIGNLPEVPKKEMQELENCFYKAKENYLLQCEENKQIGNTLTLKNDLFGDCGIFGLFDRLRNFELK